ncbi:gamma-soluble NSF attachment protein-like [Sitodiplosis mosellana]|uniref:gamma-soluble NSF attachment protein-like n=1 Tax=Sitodiplosis mosellana TaxID=263140 RepID=UPI00244480C0|nr:gamma-soluble NSF attachment protein-like [Sitodiplosis mosellana]
MTTVGDGLVQKKVSEAQEHIRQAEKSMKTGFLKWRPDFDVAADEYQKAATCYRVAKQLGQAKDYLLKASDCYKENRSLFHAARCYEQIILLLKEQNKTVEMVDFAHRACQLYQQQGSPEAGAGALEKTAKMVESKDPAAAINVLQHAVEVLMIEESSSRQAAEHLSKISRLQIRIERYGEAADTIRLEIGIHQENANGAAIGRLTVALVLVQLVREDSVAAEKAFKEWGNYCDVQEAVTLETLLQAYDDEDWEGVQRALQSPFIKHMDVDYARLANAIPLPEGIKNMPKGATKPTVVSNAQQAYTSPPPEEIEKVKAATIAAGNWPAAGVSNADSKDPPPPFPAHVDDEDEEGLC